MVLPVLAALAKKLIAKKVAEKAADVVSNNNSNNQSIDMQNANNNLANANNTSQSLAQQIMQQAGYANGQVPQTMQPYYPNNMVQQQNYSLTDYSKPLEGKVSNFEPVYIQPQQTTAQPVQQQVQQPLGNQTSNKFIQGLANGLGDFQRGFSENLNNGFKPSNLTSTQFVETIQPNNTKLADKQEELISQVDANGKRVYSDTVVNNLAQGKNSGDKNLAQWVSENQDAYPTTNYYDKGVMGKIGEGLGTAARFANSPTGQAIIGGAVGMLTGSPMFALGNAYSMGASRSKNDIYNQILNKYGIEPSQGFFYNMNDKDLNAMSNADYRYNWNQNREIANAIAQQKADQQYELGKERNDISQDRVNKNYEIGKTRNGIAQQRVNISGNKGPKKGYGPKGEWTKQEYTKYLNEDLADYSSLNSEQQKKMRPKMISTYGKDFTSIEKSVTKDPLDEYINELR